MKWHQSVFLVWWLTRPIKRDHFCLMEWPCHGSHGYCRGLHSLLLQSIWDLWWTEWQWNRFFFSPWVLQVSLFGIIPPTLPTHSFISHQFCLGFRQSLDLEHYPPHSHTWWRFIFITVWVWYLKRCMKYWENSLQRWGILLYNVATGSDKCLLSEKTVTLYLVVLKNRQYFIVNLMWVWPCIIINMWK